MPLIKKKTSNLIYENNEEEDVKQVKNDDHSDYMSEFEEQA